MGELADILGQPELSRGYRQDRETLIQRIEVAGWDGEWYLRGTFDDGSLIGSASCSEARIDSLPQSWAWLTGAAEPARAAQALESAWRHLVCEDEGLVLLFTPPFDTSEPSPGYIKGYPPGVRENGGQYTHAALWLAMAMARSGDGGRAVQLLRMLNPIEHARDAATAWRYGIEPYVVAADVYRLPGRIGQGDGPGTPARRRGCIGPGSKRSWGCRCVATRCTSIRSSRQPGLVSASAIAMAKQSMRSKSRTRMGANTGLPGLRWMASVLSVIWSPWNDTWSSIRCGCEWELPKSNATGSL